MVIADYASVFNTEITLSAEFNAISSYQCLSNEYVMSYYYGITTELVL